MEAVGTDQDVAPPFGFVGEVGSDTVGVLHVSHTPCAESDSVGIDQHCQRPEQVDTKHDEIGAAEPATQVARSRLISVSIRDRRDRIILVGPTVSRHDLILTS
jgi:hypothetical protein